MLPGGGIVFAMDLFVLTGSPQVARFSKRPHFGWFRCVLYSILIQLRQLPVVVIPKEEGNNKLMTSNGRLRWKLAIGLLAAVTFDTLLQLTWKTTVLETPADSSPWGTLGSVFFNPLFLGVIALMTLQFFNWLAVLSQADLSYAKLVTALSY